MIAPISGKKHMIYLIFSFVHSLFGIGIFEYMEKAILKLFHNLPIILSFPHQGNPVYHLCHSGGELCDFPVHLS